MAHQEEEETVAILIGDAFEPLWGPFEPFALLPLCTVPLLCYALDAVRRFDKVFLYLSPASIEALKESDKVDLPANVHLKQTTAMSEGEVLREADALQLKVPFLLLKVGYVGNVNLRAHFDNFNTVKRKGDAHLIMDCLMTQDQTSSGFTNTFALTPSSRLLHYDHSPRFPASKRIVLPKELFLEHPTMLLRQDLVHLHAYFCTPDVLPLFTENFDYQTMNHFIHGILTSDLLGKTITCSILPNDAFQSKGKMVENGTFVESPRTLASASHRLLSRAYYPLAPNEYLPSQKKERFLSRQARTYFGKRVDLARSTVVARCLIASDSVVAGSTTVNKAILGPNCTIAEHCTLDNVMLGPHCKVEEGCTLKDCWLGEGVQVLKGCSVGQGALVGDGVVVGCDVLAMNVAIAVPDDLDASAEPLPSPAKGVAWPLSGSANQQTSDSSDEEDEDQVDARNHIFTRIGWQHLSRRASTSSISSASSLAQSDNESDNESVVTTSTTDGLQLKNLKMQSNEQAFEDEMLASVERAVKEQHTVENLVIELKTMRMSSNVSLEHVRDCFLAFLTRQIPAASPSVGVKEQYAALSKLVGKWGDVFLRLSPPFTVADQVSLVLLLQQLYAPTHDSRLFILWLRVLYETDVIEEEGVVEWWKSGASRGDAGRALRSAAKGFVEKLLEEDSDSEDE